MTAAADVEWPLHVHETELLNSEGVGEWDGEWDGSECVYLNGTASTASCVHMSESEHDGLLEQEGVIRGNGFLLLFPIYSRARRVFVLGRRLSSLLYQCVHS